MTNALGAARKTPALCISIAVLAVVAIATVLAAPAKAETPGGVTPTTPEIDANRPRLPARRSSSTAGRSRPPTRPPAVKKVIAAANKIRTKPYIYGGGHGRWWDAGYDCSGAVSFALHGGSLITTPMPSGSLPAGAAPAKAAGSRSTPTAATPTQSSPASAGTPQATPTAPAPAGTNP